MNDRKSPERAPNDASARQDKDNSENCRSAVALNGERTLQDKGHRRNHRSAVEPQMTVQITEVQADTANEVGHQNCRSVTGTQHKQGLSWSEHSEALLEKQTWSRGHNHKRKFLLCWKIILEHWSR